MPLTECPHAKTIRWLKTAGMRFIPWTHTYLVFDTETTGLDTDKDLILQFGHCNVVHGVANPQYDVMLNWTIHPDVDQEWLRNRLTETRERQESKGKTYKFTYENLARDGVDPVEVLKTYHNLFSMHQWDGGTFLTHNGAHYDSKIVASHFRRFLNEPFTFWPERIIDTGMIEKAAQLNLCLQEGESTREFHRRIHKAYSKGIRWSLSEYCIPNYGLQEKYGIDVNNAHNAGFDAFATHALFEEYRRLTFEE